MSVALAESLRGYREGDGCSNGENEDRQGFHPPQNRAHSLVTQVWR